MRVRVRARANQLTRAALQLPPAHRRRTLPGAVPGTVPGTVHGTVPGMLLLASVATAAAHSPVAERAQRVQLEPAAL